MQPSTILFLAANPLNEARIRIDEECREIERKIGAGRYGDRLRFRSRWAVRPDDLLFGLLEDEPSALHFSGHGAGHEGLCFQAEDGSTVSVTAAMLDEVMRAADGRVKVVVLNACHSEVQARAVIAHVPCVIGSPHAIADGAAIAYSAAFYRALAYAHSVASAHQHGLSALVMAGNDGADRDIDEAKAALRRRNPVLLTHPEVDAKQVYLLKGAERPAELSIGTHGVQVHVEITIERDLDGLDVDTLAEMISGLRRLTGGKRVRIVCISEGSVRLTIALCPEDAARLMELRGSGQLDQICGSAISSVAEVARIGDSTNISSMEAHASQPRHPIGRALRTDDATMWRLDLEQYPHLPELAELGLPGLYAQLHQLGAAGQFGIFPASPDDVDAGRRRYHAILHRFRKILCGNAIFKQLLEDHKNSHRAELAAAIADLLLMSLGAPTAITVALIITHCSYEEICGG